MQLNKFRTHGFLFEQAHLCGFEAWSAISNAIIQRVCMKARSFSSAEVWVGGWVGERGGCEAAETLALSAPDAG